MGILTIHFGQCGIQIGQALFKYLINDITETKNLSTSQLVNDEYVELTKNLWFSDYKNQHYIPRSILVDTENKVVSSMVNNKDLLKFKNVVVMNGGGSANNWAFGYSVKAEKLKSEVCELVRKEVEKNSDVTQIVTFLSSGGGTGSGTSSRILESLRVQFPHKKIINVIILPYNSGEVVTQSYNSILTLAKLYDITDGNIILENDSLHRICSSLLSIKNVDLHHMNNVIAQKISAVFQPANNFSINDLVSGLTCHPSFKFAQLRTTPHISRDYQKFESVPSWPTLIGHMRKSLLTNHQTEGQKPVLHHCKSIASLLISRGGPPPDNPALEPLREPDLYPVWVPELYRLKHFHQPRKLYDTQRFLTLATNNNSIVNNLDVVVQQAWDLFIHRAYFHQYSKFNVLESDFEKAFEKLESILNNYKEL